MEPARVPSIPPALRRADTQGREVQVRLAHAPVLVRGLALGRLARVVLLVPAVHRRPGKLLVLSVLHLAAAADVRNIPRRRKAR